MPERSSIGRWFGPPLFRWSVAIIAAVLLGLVAPGWFDFSIFRRIGMPHEYCYQREPSLIWLHVVSDLLIGVAYVTIASTLGYLVYKASKGIPFHGVFLAFGLFIVSCGFTHFMEIWVIWEPVYWLSGYVKVVTALASVATAIGLFPLLPKVFRLVDAARRSEERRIEIEQLNSELERFNYSVAHDLRSPLRGIAGFSQALKEDCAELPPVARDYLNHINASVGRMDTLISELLKYASVGRRELELKAVNLDELVHNSLSFLAAEIQRLRAVIVVPEKLPAVQGDLTLLQVTLQNLVSNAMKFVASDVVPKVEIAATAEAGGFVRLTVTDNGIGMPAESRERAFRMFERFDRKQEGTGIGLPIVHRAVERMNGTIGISDAPGGHGTTFWVRLRAA